MEESNLIRRRRCKNGQITTTTTTMHSFHSDPFREDFNLDAAADKHEWMDGSWIARAKILSEIGNLARWR